ncbi:MAG: type III-A CRISPR-associated protein Csm2, partial [Acaryochloris sp. SU_5_25]|nr:type III-A CRISPR-associated protein Csm2 [Acaryochloris sp. SU_5_25]
MTSTHSQEPKKNTPIRKPSTPPASHQSRNHQSTAQSQNRSEDITAMIIQQIDQLTDGFSKYQIRTLVEHAEKFGRYLEENKLKTNQVRKFLDAVNRIKADLPENGDFSEIETEIVLLKPKLAYAAARQPSVEALNKVMSAAIDKVRSIDDFHRLVQFLESTIAYHKASGG